MHPTIRHWLTLSRAELDEIYRRSTPGQIPRGGTQGTAIAPVLTRPFAQFVRLIAWRGKVFDIFASESDKGLLLNRITPFNIHAVVAKVYRDASWIDGRDTIVIDYARTSLLCRMVRDEIREIEPGVYLGKVWWGKTRVLDFALTNRPFE